MKVVGIVASADSVRFSLPVSPPLTGVLRVTCAFMKVAVYGELYTGVDADGKLAAKYFLMSASRCVEKYTLPPARAAASSACDRRAFTR